jgi:hypothetical protein
MLKDIRRRLVIGFILAGFFVFPVLAGGSFSGIVGVRRLADDDLWEPVEVQNEFGILFDAGEPTWPVRIDVALHISDEDGHQGSDTERGRLVEWSFGVLRIWRQDARVRPYLGGGGSLVSAKYYGTSVEDTSPALYGRGGVLFRIWDGISVGVDARGLFGSRIDHFGTEFNADYAQIGVILRWEWKTKL